VEDWGDVSRGLSRAEPRREIRIEVPEGEEARRRMAAAVRSWRDPAIDQVIPGSPADDGGVESGDRIVSAGGRAVGTWYEFVEIVEAHPEERLELVLEREGNRLTRVVTPNSVTRADPVTGESRTIGQIGVVPPTGEVGYDTVPVGRAVVLGARETWATTIYILGFLGDLVTGDVSPRSVGSIVTIGEASGEFMAQGMNPFLRFMALFSINLAILNLLPIPVLDGGHLLFLAIEAVRGRALSVEQRLRWSQVGFFIIVGLMVWALSNDVLRLLGM